MQSMHAAHVVTVPGTYAIRAVRVPETDLLSIYINRVRKVQSTEDATSLTVALTKSDLVESTGTLEVTPVPTESRAPGEPA